MPKYIFNIVCTDDKVGDSSYYKKIKLVGNVNGEEKTIKLCGPCIGAYSICQSDGPEFFELWVESAKYNFRKSGFCDSWTDRELYKKKNIPLSNVKLKVILDEDCEYKIAVSVEDNQWITLPKSSLFGENLNLKGYYGQKLSLSRGEKFTYNENQIHYIPKVMCGQTEICELAPYSFPSCYSRKAKFEGSSSFSIDANKKIVVEKNGADELLIYFADGGGNRLTNINRGTKNVIDYLNSALKTVLLENSNIGEVLPELGIDVVTPLEKKVKCLVNKMYSEVAERVAHLEAENNEEILVTKVAGNSGLRTAIATNLKGDQGFKDSVKGATGPRGPKGEDGQSPSAADVAAQLLTGEKKDTLVTGVAGNLDLRTAVATNLKCDTNFKNSVKGEPGTNGISPGVGEVATELVTNKKDALGKAVLEVKNGDEEILVTKVASDKGLQEAIAGNHVLKDAVTTALNNDDGFHNIVKRATIESSINANNAKQKFTLQKGEKLLDDVHEANVVLNGKTMATLPKIGYYMLNDQLVVRNHVTKEKVVIPEDFHFLKVVKLYNDDYKLTFCNVLGNEFFEYKKYDPQYSNVSNEYKFISLNYAKKEYNPNFSELFGHRPSFFITEGPAEPGSPGHYQADVFELINNKKGRKIATLIDKFCYFNENDQFKCCNYHKGTECRTYDTSEINQEYRITDANSKFSLPGHDDVVLHTIPELI